MICRSRQRPEKGTVIVNSGNLQYADIVRKMRESVDVKTLGVKVERIRPNNSGGVIVTTEGGMAKSEILTRAVTHKMEDWTVRMKAQTSKQVMIHGTDTTTTEGDIQEAIVKATGRSKDELVKDEPPFWRGKRNSLWISVGVVFLLSQI